MHEIHSQCRSDPVLLAQLQKKYRVLNLLIEKYDCKPVFLPDIMEVHMYTLCVRTHSITVIVTGSC